MFGTGRDGLINAPGKTLHLILLDHEIYYVLDMDKHYTLSQAEIAVFDREAYGIMLDITTLWEIVKVILLLCRLLLSLFTKSILMYL